MPKEFKRRDDRNPKGKRPGNDKPKSGQERSGDRKTKSEKPAFKRYRDDSRPSEFGSGRKASPGTSHSEKPSFNKKRNSDRPFSKEKSDRPFSKEKSGRSFSKDRKFSKDKPSFNKKPAVNPNDLDESDFEYGKPADEKYVGKEKSFKSRNYERKPYVKKNGKPGKAYSDDIEKNDDGTVRLNKYIANAGICSRREADDLISSGVVQVNGKVITEMGYKVKPTDVIRYGGQTLKKERLVYLILNKPKDYITTADDPQKRRTVLELIHGACKERIYPVGRLDRATTGLLMFTNDGELTKKLTHPRYGVRKIYHVEIDKPLKREDLDKIAAGLELEDGPIQVDEINYVGDGKDKTHLGIEIHSGKNRIVRRIFESLGYNVRKLDRVMFGSLTKKDLPRGRWRMLTDSEVGILKMISAGK